MKKQIQVPDFIAFTMATCEQQCIVYQELKAKYELSKDIPLLIKRACRAEKDLRIAWKVIKHFEAQVYCRCKKPDANKFGIDNKCAKCGKVIKSDSKKLSVGGMKK
jgi:hypothetical protein